VSYFEWVKNLSHIRFGRMERRREESRNQLIVEELERLSLSSDIGWQLTPDFKMKYLKGATELELVRSGLDDTMRGAYNDMAEVWRSRSDVPDMRTAAYLVSVGKVAGAYTAKGL
jgi:glutamate dehydrogenase (NAD(P)+)